MSDIEFVEIIKNLIEEKKELRKRIDILEEILHSYIPTIEKEK